MLKCILIFFIVLIFTGCQQALDNLNKSLEETRTNLNSNQNSYGEYKNDREPIPRLNKQETESRYKEMFEKWDAEDKQKALEREKNRKESVVRENNERAKIAEERKIVQKDCQIWLKKSQQEVHSLGVGDNIVTMYDGKAGIIYKIKSVEKNTFLVWNSLMRKNSYVEKNSFIPFSALNKAPSKYCYE